MHVLDFRCILEVIILVSIDIYEPRLVLPKDISTITNILGTSNAENVCGMRFGNSALIELAVHEDELGWGD